MLGRRQWLLGIAGCAYLCAYIPSCFLANFETDRLLVFLGCTVCVASVLWCARVAAGGPAVGRYLTVACLLAFVIATGQQGRHWHQEFPAFYDRYLLSPVPSFLHKEAQRGELIVVLFSRPYPFFGSHREVRIAQPSYLADANQMRAYVETKQARFVVSHAFENLAASKGYAEAHEWLNGSPNWCRLRFDGRIISLFEVTR